MIGIHLRSHIPHDYNIIPQNSRTTVVSRRCDFGKCVFHLSLPASTVCTPINGRGQDFLYPWNYPKLMTRQVGIRRFQVVWCLVYEVYYIDWFGTCRGELSVQPNTRWGLSIECDKLNVHTATRTGLLSHGFMDMRPRKSKLPTTQITNYQLPSTPALRDWCRSSKEKQINPIC